MEQSHRSRNFRSSQFSLLSSDFADLNKTDLSDNRVYTCSFGLVSCIRPLWGSVEYECIMAISVYSVKGIAHDFVPISLSLSISVYFVPTPTQIHHHHQGCFLYFRTHGLVPTDIPVSSLWHGRLRHLIKVVITHLSRAAYIPKLSFSDHQFCERY